VTARPVRVGHAGLGVWGPNIARNLADAPEAELRWVCDADRERLDRFATRLPRATATVRFEDLLEDAELDAVTIATPVPTHYELARRVLEAGKHVFVEKPLALTAAQAEELAAAGRERGLVVMPGHLLLYHPGVAKLKQLVDSGELGDVLYVYGNRQNLGQIRPDENALWSLGAHDVSVILHLVGEDPAECVAHGESYLREGVEDVVFCYLRFPSGIVAHMHLSWLDPHKMRKMTVVGRTKMAVFDDMELERKVTVYEKFAEQPAESYGEWRTRTGDIFSPKIPNDEPLRLEVERFLELVRAGGPAEEEAAMGVAVVRCLERLQRSLEGR
jgi:predicted dehydrogenase